MTDARWELLDRTRLNNETIRHVTLVSRDCFDISGDLHLSIIDYVQLASRLGCSDPEPCFDADLDINTDLIIDDLDLRGLFPHWNTSCL